MLKTLTTKFSTPEILPEITGNIIVVVVLIATMAFQAAVSPPGGVWQDDSSTHKAGEAVMASTHPRIFKKFLGTNTVAFGLSIFAIFLLATGLLSKSMHAQGMAIYAMWVSIASIAVSYGASLIMITPNTKAEYLYDVIVLVAVTPFITIVASIVGDIMIKKCWRSVRLQGGVLQLWRSIWQQVGNGVSQLWRSIRQQQQGAGV